MRAGFIVAGLAALVLGGCQAANKSDDAEQKPNAGTMAAAPQKQALLAALSKSIGVGEARLKADAVFRIWPRQLADDQPFGWGVRADDVQMIESPVGGGLAQRMELRTAGKFAVRMQPPPGKRLFFQCSVEPSSMGDPNTPGMVQWSASFDGSIPPAHGNFSRDPLTNYWSFATSNESTGNMGYVEITSPNGPLPIWAIGFCDVLVFEAPPPG